jgi:hypothetical protein
MNEMNPGFLELDVAGLLAINGGGSTATKKSGTSGSSYTGSSTKSSTSGSSYTGSTTKSSTSGASRTSGSSYIRSSSTTVSTKIQSSITSNRNQGYTPTYKCDNWVAEVLSDAGINYRNYLCGDPSEKNCEEHIANLKTKGSSAYTTKVPTQAGVYVVLMNEGKQQTNAKGEKYIPEAHCALLVVNSNGTAVMWDDSSGNNNKAGGVASTPGKTGKEVVDHYVYNTFYYQKVQ